jgi:hypothetical protein
MTGVCAICKQGSNRVGRVMVNQDFREDPRHPEHGDFTKHGTAVGTFVDVCRPFSAGHAMQELGVRDPAVAAQAAQASMACLAALIQQNPALRFRDIEHTTLGEHWTF